MLEIKNTKIHGLYNAIVTSSFPMTTELPDKESWSVFECYDYDYIRLDDDNMWDKRFKERFIKFIGEDFFERRQKLGQAKSGSGHDCMLKGINVIFDLKYSLYFTKQIQRYHFIDFISSQSTMHKLTSKTNITDSCNKYVDKDIIKKINSLINEYNEDVYELEFANNFGADWKIHKQELFMKIISNLPSGYEQWAGMTTNYLQLKSIYNQRKNHKLEDWHIFCDWIETLPLFKELCIGD